MRKTKEYICQNCNNKYESSNFESRFCSRTCSAAFNNRKRGERSEETKFKISKSLKGRCIGNSKGREIKPIKCINCGKNFLPVRKSIKYCSFKCSLEGRGYGEKGEISYRTFRKMIRRAFPNWHCPFCEWNYNFDIHHIDGRKIENANDTSKLIMLCPNHHWKAHNGLISRDDLLKNAIGAKYSKEDLLKMFYQGENKKVQLQSSRLGSNEKAKLQRKKKVVFKNASMAEWQGI